MRKIKITGGFIFSLLFIMLSCYPAFGSAKTIQSGTTVKVKAIHNGASYRLILPSDGYIQIKWAEGCGGKMFFSLKDNQNIRNVDDFFLWSITPNNCMLALEKGTYYFYPYVYGKKTQTFTYKFVSQKTEKPKNTTKAKAITLPRNKYLSLIANPQNTLSCWYKINVPKDQYLKFFGQIAWWELPGRYMEVYDSKMNKIELQKSGNSSYARSVKKCKSGTYYIKLKVYGSDNPYRYVYRIKWR